MDPIAEKRDALRRAEEILARGVDHDLRYAALELRRCIEAVVYEKLFAYRGRLPRDVARVWQPPQAFKALAQLEPGALHSATISVAPQMESGVPSEGPFHVVGRDLRPPISWLNRAWNKLGSFLHASSPFGRNNTTVAAEMPFLTHTASELHQYVDRSFTSTLAVVISFECSECGKVIVVNADGARQLGKVDCLNATCGATYFVSFDGTEATLTLDASHATCPDCGADIPLLTSRIKLDYEFPCRACGQVFRVAQQNWAFEKADKEARLNGGEDDA